MNRRRSAARTLVGLPNVSDRDLNRMFRRQCSDTACGSARLSWMSVEELPVAVPPNLEERAVDLLEMLGDDTDRAEAWMCLDCFNFGVLGGSQSF